MHARIWQIALLDLDTGAGQTWLVNPGFSLPTERSLKLSSLARLCNVQQEDAHTALADLRTLAACMESEDRRLWSEWWHIDQHRAWVAGDLPADEMQAIDSLIYGGTLGAIGQDGLARIGRSAGRTPDNWTFRTALHNGCDWSTNVGHPWLERAWIDWLNSATPGGV